MPKTNLCKPREDPRGKELRAIILGGMARKDINTKKDLSKKTNIKASTLSAHFNNPEDMRLGELWAIIDLLKLEEQDKIKIL